MIVLDASLSLELLLKTPVGERNSAAILRDEVHAPHLIDIEFAHSLRRLVRLGLDAAVADDALESMRSWTFKRHVHTPLLPRIWQLRASVSAYDAAYIALAEGLDVPLLTCDGQLSRSHGHNATIKLMN